MGTKLFNGGMQPLVPAGKWGEGVVMPGEYIEVDDPETYGSPWTEDAEAASALLRLAGEGTGVASDSAPDGVSGAQGAPQPPPDEGPPLRTLDNGDVLNEAGEIVGHIEPAGSGQGGNA